MTMSQSQTQPQTPTTLQRDAELNSMILEGSHPRTPSTASTPTKSSCRRTPPPRPPARRPTAPREEQFVGSVEALHEIKLVSAGAGTDGTTYGVWVIDASYKGAGRVRSEQVAVRTWKDGAVIREQFFHA
jgi:hypothetical protein